MQVNTFISVGENIHCTRILKVGGKSVKPTVGEQYVIHYRDGDEQRQMPVPKAFMENADWQNGKLKHCAAAIWLGLNGRGDEQEAGKDYLRAMAKTQAANGASYLDINVDEYGTDTREKIDVMRWTVGIIQDSVTIPMSIDSSNIDILAAGLTACDSARGRPMVNSVSLERLDAVDVAATHRAVVIASAAGEKGMPSTSDERLANLDRLIPLLKTSGFRDDALHIDPLVFPISVDGNNGPEFLKAVRGVRNRFGSDVHIVAGLSNVSFGMPNRRLINQVFTYLAVERGADGGIVDPLQINRETLNAMDPDDTWFGLARDLLLGEDDFGMNYITACRESEG